MRVIWWLPDSGGALCPKRTAALNMPRTSTASAPLLCVRFGADPHSERSSPIPRDRWRWLRGVSVRREPPGETPPVRSWMRWDLGRSAHVWVSVPGDNLIPFRLGESWRIPPLGARARRGVLCNEFRSFQHKGSLQECLLQKILGSLPYHPSETSVVDQ